jgi:23S rRNA pseudouridine2605 synthase
MDQATPQKRRGRVQLVRVFTKAAVASRTQAREYILDGRVTVNGQVITHIMEYVDLETDDIRFDGQPLKPIKENTYILFHKPAGYVTTRSDTEERPTIYDLLPSSAHWIFPVGRLDMDSEGLLLLTDDGILGNWLKDPESNVPKRYKVLIHRSMLERDCAKLERGIFIKGILTKPCKIKHIGKDINGYWMSVTLSEGKKRQIRQMMQALGYRVFRLIRTHIGPLALNDLPLGEWRNLTEKEVETLKQLCASHSSIIIEPLSNETLTDAVPAINRSSV